MNPKNSEMLPGTIEEYINNISPDLIPILRRTNVIASGSVALYYKMKELGMEPNFIPKDLDILHINESNEPVDFSESNDCFNTSNSEQPKGYLELNQWFDTTFRDMTDFEKTEFGISMYSGDPLYYNDYKYVTQNIPKTLMGVIKHVRSGIRDDGTRIDCVLICSSYKGSPKDFVEEYFDLDFCKCYYDGRSIVCNHVDSILTRSCKLTRIPMANYVHIDPKFLIEYLKCVKNDKIPEVLNTKNDPARMFRRIRKYRNLFFS